MRGSSAFALLVLAVWSAHASRLLAAAPTLDQIYPVAVQVGTTTVITAAGKFAPWPPKVWTDAPGISIRAGEKTGQFSVEVGPDVPVGPHLLRFFNETGASAPRFIIVTPDPQVTETEPNDEFAKAPLIEKLPTTINGRLNKSGDVDSYAVQLEAGQSVRAAIDAYVLGSPMDAVIRVVDTRGLELALNHDNGRNLDPSLTWTAGSAGTYVLQVFGFAHPATADVRFTGSDACVYRLHLSRGPQVRYTLPLGLTRTQPAKLRVFGWNLRDMAGREFEVDGPAVSAGSRETTWRIPEFENTLVLPLGDGPEWMEQEFLRRLPESPVPAPPLAITGCIEDIGEEDRFDFVATKGDMLVLEIRSASLGFPLDAWLAIQDSAGKELVRADDGPNADPLLEWTAPETGSYVAVVGSVLHRSGADHLYRLSIQRAQPRFQAVIAESGFAVEPGKTIKIKVTARRVQGFKARLTASVAGLPEGLTAGTVELGETEKDVIVEVTAAAEAPPFAGPIQIHFREADSDTVIAAVHEMVSTTLKNGVPQGFRDLVIPSTNQIWLTVLPAPQATPAGEK